MFRRLSGAFEALQPLGLPGLELLHGVDSDTELNEMDGHSRERPLKDVMVPPSYPASVVDPTEAGRISPAKITGG
jgi:hypothetical protein